MTRGDPVDLWDPGRGITLARERGEKAVLSRTPAVAAASVGADVYAENAESRPESEIFANAGDAPAVARRANAARAPRERANPRAAGSKRRRSAGVEAGALCAKDASSPFGVKGVKSSGEERPRAKGVRIASLTDQELLEGLRAQSEPHFAELYDRYFQRIYNFVYARIRNHVECEEIVQETFIAVFRSFSNYRGQSSLLSWIYGIAKNTTNNTLRRARTLNDRVDLVEEAELLPAGALGSHTPDALLDLQRFREELNERLEQVADWQAEIFAMRHFENLSIPEISRRTQRSSDAVRSSLYRVKRIFFESAQPGSGAFCLRDDALSVEDSVTLEDSIPAEDLA